jgi:hypothetical protein
LKTKVFVLLCHPLQLIWQCHVATYKWKVHNGKIENDPEQLAHASENSPALSLSETDSGPVESESCIIILYNNVIQN